MLHKLHRKTKEKMPIIKLYLIYQNCHKGYDLQLTEFMCANSNLC